jgi:hypothetical protein
MVDELLGFQFETCLLKHHVRVNGWLPRCEARLQDVRATGKPRRLRYFTFCAVGAVDVLMLDVARIVKMSDQRKFDTVVFFDKDTDHVNETLKRIPGSIGFNGVFTDVVLLDLHAGAVAADTLSSEITDEDTLQTRKSQRDRDQHLGFIKQFPFDIVNLDLEEFLFKDRDPTPGKVISSIRKIFEWQRRPISLRGNVGARLDKFSFMFTTQVGPGQLATDHRNTLVRCLSENIADVEGLDDLLEQKTTFRTADDLLQNDFEVFFKIAVPKAVTKLGLTEDWYCDPDTGARVFEFTRPSANGPYKMLHLVMDFVKPVPDREHRVGDIPEAARNAYATSVRRIVTDDVIVVTPETIDVAMLRSSLKRIFQRRKQLYPEDITPEL